MQVSDSVRADSVLQSGMKQKDLGEVVVTGTMREMKISESPIPVETYSSAYFRKTPAPNLFESLGTLNGVQPQLNCNVCNTGDIHINGMEGPYTMILIDGMPIVSSLSTVYGLSGIPTSLIKRIEVVKGPASTLYGSEAVAGLINVITQEPGNAPRLLIDANTTTWQEHDLDLGGAIRGKRWQGLIGLNGYWYQTPRDDNGDGFTDVTLQRRASLFSKWTMKRANGLPFSFATRVYAENRWGGEMNWTDEARGSNTIYGESIWTQRVELFGRYGIKAGPEVVGLDYSYNYHHQDSYYGIKPYDAHQHTGFAQLRWEKKAGSHYLLAGLPYRFIYYDDNTPATSDPVRGTQPAITHLPGVFAQDEWNFTPKWTLLSGLRYEHHNVQGSIWSPRLALKWAPATGRIFRASGGNGFRVVNLATEDHLALSGARELVILEDLKPEKSWNGTLNTNLTYPVGSGYITVDGSAFYTYFTSRILPDYATDPQKIIYRNLQGHSVSQGLSLNVDLALKSGFKALLGATLLDAFTMSEDGQGGLIRSEQLFAPRISATWVVSYALRKAGLSFDLTGKLYGPQRLPTVPNDYRSDYSQTFGLVNAQITKKWKGGVEVYLAGKNLLNFVPTGAILHSDDPFDRAGGKYFDAAGAPRQDTNPNGYTFDPSYNYAPLQGIRALLGIRYTVR